MKKEERWLFLGSLLMSALGIIFSNEGPKILFLVVILFVFYFYFYIKKSYALFIYALFVLFSLYRPSIVPILQSTPEIFSVKTVKEKYYIIEDSLQINFLFYSEQKLTKGSTIKITGTILKLQTNGMPLIFDFTTYLQKKRIYYQINASKIEILYLAEDVRQNLIYNFTSSFKGNAKNFVSLLVFGVMDRELYDMSKNIGVVHLFVISGFHIQLLFLFIKKTIGLFVKNEYFLLFLIIPYLWIIQFTIPALRAFFLILFQMINKKIFKNYFSRDSLLFILAIIFLLIEPLYLFDFSFLLTFYMTLLLSILSSSKNQIKKAVLIHLSFFPFLLFINQGINLFSIFNNFFLSFLISPIFILCILSTVFSFFSFITNPLIYGFIAVLEKIESYTWMIYFPSPSFIFLVLYFIVILSAIFYFTENLKKQFFQSIMILLIFLLILSNQTKLLITESVYFINVGQGDCALLYKNNQAILIDTGGNKYANLATRTLIPYFYKLGITFLNYVIITHNDFDHQGELDELSLDFPIGKIINNDFSLLETSHFVIKNLNYQSQYGNDNDDGRVLYFTLCGLNFLFLSDVSIQVEKDLVSKYKNLPVDVIKIGHHGSNTSTSDELLFWFKPKYSIISVGKNYYGHPNKEVIKKIESYKSVIFRTDKNGLVEFRKNIFGTYIIPTL